MAGNGDGIERATCVALAPISWWLTGLDLLGREGYLAGASEGEMAVIERRSVLYVPHPAPFYTIVSFSHRDNHGVT